MNSIEFLRPLLFSVHEKPTTVYLPNELRAKAEDQARANSYRHLSPFLSALVEKMLNFTFLDPKNLEFLQELRAELGEPWDVVLVLNRVITFVRQEMHARRLVLGGFFYQHRNGRKAEAR